jgi:hypothetical protein
MKNTVQQIAVKEVGFAFFDFYLHVSLFVCQAKGINLEIITI